jgi:hypothetical protein
LSTAPKLSDYLRAKSDEQEKKKESCSPAGCLFPLGFAFVMYGLAAQAWWGMLTGLGTVLLAILVAAVSSRASARTKAQESGPLGDFLWLEGQRALGSRVDPRALPLLEACAAARNLAVSSLESETWLERAKDSNWAQIRAAAIEAAEGAMVDALSASREMVRTKGMKKTVFESRCADSAHGARAIERLSTIRRDLEELAGRVRVEQSASEPEPSSIRKVLEDLQQVHEAQRELDEDVPRLTT